MESDPIGWGRLASRWWVLALLAVAFGSQPGAAVAARAPTVTITVLSNRADLISGGQALVAVDMSQGSDPSKLRMTPPASIPLGPSAACSSPKGRLAGSSLGALKLGLSRARARGLFSHSSTRGRRYVDFFCLTASGIRAGYPSPMLLRELTPGQRQLVRGRVVLALTASRHYALHGVRPGWRFAKVARRLRVGRGLRIGLNTWYIAPGRVANGVLKVRHGVIEEIGIANKRLTNSREAARRLLKSFS